MRAVADTNIVVSGLLWQGAPRRVLELARAGDIELFTSPALLLELEEVLFRDKFSRRLKAADVSPEDLVLGYAALARVISPPPIGPAVEADPDDDEVLACAVAVHAYAVISGDRHLLNLGEFQAIPVLTPARFLAELR
ncbi:MAG TPA: putative toxin-antitoxin system toxin component, PIN family [Thermoanaerobaculia bacterium]|nr:putative toxin-antitoxin system toxin component, PIN family [Thermoanaerobaculia bacterium]